jgi:hypothetical protein
MVPDSKIRTTAGLGLPEVTPEVAIVVAEVLRLRRLACCKAAHSGQLFSIWAAQEAKGC